MLGPFFAIIFWLALIALICMFLYIPILIANSRGVSGGERIAIIVLSWLGIFFGITWIIALIMSLACSGTPTICSDNLDSLEKLSRLYRQKMISKKEFEELKSKILNH